MAGSVWVICKLPNGLHLDVDSVVSDGMNLTGERDTTKRVTLRGQNARNTDMGLLHAPLDQRPGVTKVDKEFWEAWLKTHEDFAPVANGMIYAVDQDPDRDKGVQREMDDLGKETNGFDPVDQDKGAPPTMPKAADSAMKRD